MLYKWSISIWKGDQHYHSPGKYKLNPPHIHQTGKDKTNKMIPNVGKEVGQLELFLYIVGGKVGASIWTSDGQNLQS